MAQNISIRKEFRNSSKKTKRSTSVFYLDSTTTDKTLLIESEDNSINDDHHHHHHHHHHHDQNEKFYETNIETISSQLKCNNNSVNNNNYNNNKNKSDNNILLKKSQSFDDCSTSTNSSASYSILSDCLQSNVTSNASSSSTNTSSSSFQYDYSVNSTIACDLPDQNVTTNIIIEKNIEQKKPKVPERKKTLLKLKLNQNSPIVTSEKTPTTPKTPKTENKYGMGTSKTDDHKKRKEIETFINKSNNNNKGKTIIYNSNNSSSNNNNKININVPINSENNNININNDEIVIDRNNTSVVPHSDYWSNEIQVGVTKTNYVQKLRLKFEMFSNDTTTTTATTPSSTTISKSNLNEIPIQTTSKNVNNNSFLSKITSPRRKTCHSGFNIPSTWNYLSNYNINKNNNNNNNNSNNNSSIKINNNFINDNDKLKLLSDCINSEDEVDEISDCEEIVEIRNNQKIEKCDTNILKKEFNRNDSKRKSKKKLKRNLNNVSITTQSSSIPTTTPTKPSTPLTPTITKIINDDIPQIIVNDFGEISLKNNEKSNVNVNDNDNDNKNHNNDDDNNSNNDHHNCESQKQKVNIKPEIKKRKGIVRSIDRRRTDICEAKNLPCILSKSYSYHPDELLSGHLSDRDITSNNSDIEETTPYIEKMKCPIDEFKYGTEGILPMVEELIKTEEKYVESLREGIKNYGGMFNRSDLPDALKGKRYDLLGNVEEILEFHETLFLPILKTNSHDLVTMFNSFTNLIEENEFYPYIIFVINKRNSIRLLEKNQSYFKELQAEIDDRLGINSFLIKPIQRLQRYPLPLQEFYKTKFGDISYKAAIAACCKLEKRLRDFITVVNESENINDIEDCFDLNIYYQGRFIKADDFKIYDYSIRKLYSGKGFFFEKCIIYTEIKEKRLLYRGHYPVQKLGFLPSSKSTKFTLYCDKRKKQECDFESEPHIIDIWIKLIQPILEAEAEEIKKNDDRHLSQGGMSVNSPSTNSIGSSGVIFRQFNYDDFNNGSRISADSGIESMTPAQSIRTTDCSNNEEIRMSTWYDTM